MSISELRIRHKKELENLTLSSQPLKTQKLFTLAVIQYLKRSVSYLLSNVWLLLLSALVVASVTIDGPHTKHIIEIQHYVQFGLWWIVLGVASSFGVGMGLHTFVIYLGPHLAAFTAKAMECGRVDLKSGPYDTIQLNKVSTWLGKGCSEFGPPLFEPTVPLSSILPQVQLEAILWGLGTALGELPPYFVARAARLSGTKVDAMEELDASTIKDGGFISTRLTRIKRWFLSHSQYHNFFTILILASVPNPLFDLAGMLCGQFGIPFWKFFFATIIGKAFIKTHIQTVFMISVCNNQLLHWVENELIRVFSFIPGFKSILPDIITRLHAVKAKYMTPHVQTKGKRWDFSLATIWNGMVWFMLMSYFVRIVDTTAQHYLKKQQEHEIAALNNNSPKNVSDDSDISCT